MAVGVKLNNAWYLCDIGWGGFLYEGALAITTEPTLSRRFTARCVESAHHTPEASELAPGLTRWWDVEYANPDWEFPNFDNMLVKRDGTWKKTFRFRLESAPFDDFKDECHRLHTDTTRTLFHTSILARCGEREFRGVKCPYWRGFFGYQEMEIVFVSNMHFVRSMKLHDNIESINSVLVNELNITIPADHWRCGSTINVMVDPTVKKTSE